MRRLSPAFFAAFALALSTSHGAAQTAADMARFVPAARRITAAALADSLPHRRLAALVDGFGHRLSGSASLEQAIDWVLAEMQRDGFANVRGEPVMVPHWVRGSESATLVSPREAPLHMLGLGGSVGTNADGVTADVIVVHSFDELERRKAEAAGKIVLFNTPFPRDSEPFAGYGVAVQYRGSGATAAAKAGAVAMLLRSVATYSMQSPHTGGLRYDATVTKIPAAALSIEDAEMLDRMQARGEKVRVTLKMSAQTLPDAPSRNIVAELRGRELPDEVVVIGGHIDSWDVGQGAMDDAAGSVAAWEAVKLLKRLGITPRRTVRVVLFTNEENGLRGGTGYRDAHRSELAKHFAAIESDNGIFAPRGFRFQGTKSAARRAALLAPLTRIAGAPKVAPGDGEADVGPIIEEGVPGFALDVDGSKYFWYHHSSADMLNAVSDADLRRCVAAMAVLAYALAEMPGTLR
ncbi:MAG: M20/M25/M40 family metallo-hydrolase [Gemmatimonadaceae bacterium]|nr:M20/M25/M40 family metallo-hydrolase [Gemmatimonadaceae bacterium]